MVRENERCPALGIFIYRVFQIKVEPLALERLIADLGVNSFRNQLAMETICILRPKMTRESCLDEVKDICKLEKELTENIEPRDSKLFLVLLYYKVKELQSGQYMNGVDFKNIKAALDTAQSSPKGQDWLIILLSVLAKVFGRGLERKILEAKGDFDTLFRQMDRDAKAQIVLQSVEYAEAIGKYEFLGVEHA